MAAENAAEVAALRGWKVYFNTVTIAGRRNVSGSQPVAVVRPVLSTAAGHCYLDLHPGHSVAQQEEKTAQGTQTGTGLEHSTPLP